MSKLGSLAEAAEKRELQQLLHTAVMALAKIAVDAGGEGLANLVHFRSTDELASHGLEGGFVLEIPMSALTKLKEGDNVAVIRHEGGLAIAFVPRDGASEAG